MKKTIGIERTFFLGNFKNLRYTTTIEDIPDALFFNEEFMDALRTMMLLEADRAYFNYSKDSLTMVEKIKPEEAIEIIDKVSTEKLENLKLAFAEKKE